MHETVASLSFPTAETPIGEPFAHAPSPRAAHQRRAERGRRDDAAHEMALALERDQRRPDRDPAQEVPRAVDRVDDPADVASVVALLLAEHAFTRPVARDAIAQHALGRAVGVGDRREVGLRLDVQVARAKARQRQRVGGVCKLECVGEVGVHTPTVLTERS